MKKNNSIKFPKIVKVGSLQYTVVFPYVFVDQPTYVGLHNGPTAIIRIADTYQESKRGNQVLLETYMHELLHAIDFVYGCDSVDEDTIAVFARAWLQVLQDNNLFLYTQQVPKRVKVGCFTYKVNYPYSSVENSKTTIATTSNSRLDINIDHDDGAENFSLKFIKVVLLHGIMSAISCTYFNNDADEGEINSMTHMKKTSMSNGLYQVLTDNKVDMLIDKYKSR